MYTEVSYLDTSGATRHRRFPNSLELQGWLDQNTDTENEWWKSHEQGGEITKLLTARTVMEVSDLPRTELTLFKGPSSREPIKRYLITEVRTALPEDNPINDGIAWILRGKPTDGNTESLFADEDVPEEDFAQASAKAVGDLLCTTVHYPFPEWSFGWVHPLFETGFENEFIAARSHWQMTKVGAMRERLTHEKAIRKAMATCPYQWGLAYGKDTNNAESFFISFSPNGRDWKTRAIHTDGFEVNFKNFLMELHKMTLTVPAVLTIMKNEERKEIKVPTPNIPNATKPCSATARTSTGS